MNGWLLGHRVLVLAVSRGTVAGVVTEVPATSAPDHQVLIALIAALGSIAVALITGIAANGFRRARTPPPSDSATDRALRLAEEAQDRADELQRQLDARRRQDNP